MPDSLKLNNNSERNKNMINDTKIVKKEQDIKSPSKKNLKINIEKNRYHYTNFIDNLD